MPQIVIGPNQTGALDASVKKQAYAFLEKLAADDTNPSLHIEPITNSADGRVRTGRVTDYYRAVLFKVQGQGTTAHYVYLGVLGHDDAITYAKKVRLTVNPVNGIAEVLTVSDEAEASTVAPDVHAAAVNWDAAPAVLEALLPARGMDETALVDELGLDVTLARRALAATTEDEILALAADAIQWQGLALIDLASGTALSDVMAALDVSTAPTPAAGTTEDDQLLAALEHPAAKLQFAFIEDDDELRRAIEDDDFAAWRVFLHPEQRRYDTASYSGPFRLSGGAGTGKTVVLLHRARHLARQNPAARILLTTFTRNLAEAMKADLRRLDPDVVLATKLGDPGIFACGIDATASAVLKTHKGDLAPDLEQVFGTRSDEIAGRTPDTVWVDAATAAGPQLPPDLRSRAFLAAEYAMVVLPAQVTNRDGYLTARRPGRGVALDRKKRLAVWQIIEAYRARASIDGTIDFVEAAALASATLTRRAEAGHPVDHVLVDEGQDLHPSHWKFLRALVAHGRDDLFLAEDSHQRIYGQRVVLGRYGVKIVGRSQRLKLNYRTTAQNLTYAVRILDGQTGWSDLEDAPEDAGHYRSARSGPAPRLLECSSVTEELEAAATAVQQWLDDGVGAEAIGILARDAAGVGQVTRGLEDRGITVRPVEHGQYKQGPPVVMTMHRAKGMEFSRVLLFGVSEGLMPAEYLLKDLTEADRADALTRERSLLYVAATRARDELVVTTGSTRSDFLPPGRQQ